MSLVVVGSIAFDSVKTPDGEVREELGGSAAYFATAASFFTDVQMVAVVGNDFPAEHKEAFRKHRIDLEGLEQKTGKTFRWQGEYGDSLSDVRTIHTELNVLASFHPQLPDAYKNTPYLFLANIDPGVQKEVITQMAAPKQIVLDTMKFWIEGDHERLSQVVQAAQMVIINESEARAWSGEWNILRAAKTILSWGPAVLVIKRGEYGAMLFDRHRIFSVPAYPLESVVDPTGAGDSFAGGFMGFLAKQDNVNEKTVRQAVLYGAVMASFCVESFGLRRMWNVTLEAIENRYAQLLEMMTYA